jgi:FHS family glucose/mannose:H+ symporter-like MFS transporter
MHRERELSATAGVILASATFAAVGGCLTVPGTLLPVLVDAFRIRLVEAGSMFALQATAYVLSVASAGPVIRRCGMRVVLTVGMLGFAAGFAGFGAVSTWWGGATMLFISGLGFGVVEVALDTLLIVLGGARRANLLNLSQFFFAVGAFIGPAAAARVVAGGVSWRAVFGVAGGLAAVVALAWALQPVPRAVPVDDGSTQTETTSLRSKLAILMALMLAAYVGAEMGIGGWLSKYMVEIRGVDLTYAGTTVSLYWMGIAAGRLVLTATSHYVSEERLLLWLTIGAAAVLAFGLAVQRPALAVAAFALTGLGFSGIFPGVIALAGRYHPQNVAGITSVVVTGAGLGGIIIPWVMSAIADGFGLVAGMGFYLLMCVVMVVLAVAINALGPSAGNSSALLESAAPGAGTTPQRPHAG